MPLQLYNFVHVTDAFMMLTGTFGQTGLRGAMAFALALQSVHELPEGHGKTIFTTTTAIVVLTVLAYFWHLLVLTKAHLRQIYGTYQCSLR